MPLMERQPDALARVYAESLFELAEARGGREALEETLGELEDILELAREDARFSEFLASRVLGVQSRGRSLKRILQGRCTDLTLRFILLLNQKDRIAHLPPIVAAFDEMVQQAFGRVEVDVYTASPISTGVLRTIRERFRAAMGKDAIVHPYADESMIGGMKLRIGDTLIDASIASQLRRLKEQLNDSGSERLRERVERIIEDASNG